LGEIAHRACVADAAVAAAAQAIDLRGDTPHPPTGADVLEREATRRRHRERDLALGKAQAVVARLRGRGDARAVAAAQGQRADVAVLKRQLGRHVGIERQVRQGRSCIESRSDERRQVRPIVGIVQGLEQAAKRFRPDALGATRRIDPVDGDPRLARAGAERLFIHPGGSRKAAAAGPCRRPRRISSPAPARDSNNRSPTGCSIGQRSPPRLLTRLNTAPSSRRQRATTAAGPTDRAASARAPAR
jgi:hypothetical protein